MNKISTDIDIDFKNRNDALAVLPHIAASMVNQGKSSRHNTGIYFQNIPVDPLTGHASIPYGKAEDLGYFKIDLINNSVYEGVRDIEHLEKLLDADPAWDLLDDPEIVSMLAHIHSHFDVVSAIKPKSVDDLAVVLALIRPGKKHLVNKSRAEIDAEVWLPPSDGSYTFKRAHAYAYSLSIVVQLNAIVEQATQ